MSFNTLELLKLYDVSSISFTDDEEELKNEIIEKTTRILGATKIAVFTMNNNGSLEPFCIWGYTNYSKNHLTPGKIREQSANNTFIYEFDSGLISFGNSSRIANGEQKLYNIFSKRLEDILKRIQYRKYLEYLSIHDTLTGLYNRAYIEEKMKRLDTSSQLPMSIIMADLNGLKLVNDTYGHETGDEMLQVVANILRDSCRKEEIIARWGGDEFVILLPQTTEKGSEFICQTITNNLQEAYVNNIPISLAFGTGVKRSMKEEIKNVLKQAEDNMYKKKLAESCSARSAVINTLLKTLGAKSYETEVHTQRMIDAALKIGEKLGLSESELNRLQLLITLHDIGKINIPEETLTKEESLTEEEWEVIKKHPEVGYRVALTTKEFAHTAEDILAHHERWDGKGYPRGLKEKEIPLLARITSIVDAFDVMLNGRPYKKAMPKEEIIAEFRKCAGTQFDPELIDVFLGVLDEQKSI